MDESARLLKSPIHKLSALYYKWKRQQFIHRAQSFKKIQIAKLRNYHSRQGEFSFLPVPSLKDRQWFTTFADYQEHFTQMRERTGRKMRWIPTSGSTLKRKWIPYTPEFVDELNKGIDVFFGSLYRENPCIQHGSHYWALSWLPNELRQETTNDDSQPLSLWKRIAFSVVCRLPRKLNGPLPATSLGKSCCNTW